MKKKLNFREALKLVVIIISPLFLYNCNKPYQESKTGIIYKATSSSNEQNKLISISILSPDIVRVSIAENDSLLSIPSIIAKEYLHNEVPFTVTDDEKFIKISTDSLKVYLNKNTLDVSFLDIHDNLLLASKKSDLVANSTNKNRQYQIQQDFDWKEGEALYGLGQHELKSLNMRRKKIKLTQHNTRVSVPVVLSTKGYGLYWDNYSQSYFNDKGKSSYFASQVADKIQYFFVRGKQFDNVIAGLRELTGESPMLPRWAFGFFQSRNRYKNSGELMEVVKKHRELEIPLDAIILDYMHWGDHGWGSMVFDETDFPKAEEMINELHKDYNCKLITSVWPSFKKDTHNWELFKKDSLLLNLNLNPVFGDVYDAYNPKAGELYWNLVKKNYWDKGVDGIWFDATEPENIQKFKQTTCFLGATAKYQNLFSYFDMKNVFEPQLEIDTNRVFVLTRSAFLGQQKFGAVVWSGDVGTDFKTLKEQIPTGLNFCMTGIPYWNTDIGGYLGGNPEDPKYQEVFVRWFQYGAFTPMMRSHGRRHPFESRSGKNEIWSYGKENQKILTQFINLRYRLLPYFYSLSYRVHNEGYTFMRALVFDFINDEAVYNISDQFLVGDIMVCPVTEAGVTERKVYLPKGCDWFDFWTGKKYKGGQTIISQTSIKTIPLFVKAGTILPLADVSQYSSEKPLHNIELRIYPGKNAEFNLYEDEGDNYNYKNGEFSTIQFKYSENGKSLTIDDINGGYKGMLKNRNIQVGIVSEGVAVGVDKITSEKTINYKEKKVEIGL